MQLVGQVCLCSWFYIKSWNTSSYHYFWSETDSCNHQNRKTSSKPIMTNHRKMLTVTKSHTNKNWNINWLERSGFHKYPYFNNLPHVTTLCVQTTNTKSLTDASACWYIILANICRYILAIFANKSCHAVVLHGVFRSSSFCFI